MGGMLAARHALLFPDGVEQLVMVNPLGLEDWLAEGVPYASVDQSYRNELRTTAETIRNYQLRYYYNGRWKPEYDQWVEMAAGLYAGSGRERVAWNQALTMEMIFTQPVLYEFPRLRVPTVLFIGGMDRTAPGAARAPAEVAQRLGDYPVLGRRAAAAIPRAKLVEFADLGHSPQVEAPDRFHDALLEALQAAR
jgi:pimeloyl-ACP methyl ester carboxylesterase